MTIEYVVCPSTRQLNRKGGLVKVGDFPTGECSFVLLLSKQGKTRVLRGEIKEKKGVKSFFVRRSPKVSFSKDTIVVWFERGGLIFVP